MMLPCEMVQKLWVHSRLSFTSTTGFSLNITTFALTSAYSTLPLPLTTPIITTMQVPRLLDIQFKTEDSDYHGHRTHTSLHDASTLPAFRRLSLGMYPSIMAPCKAANSGSWQMILRLNPAVSSFLWTQPSRVSCQEKIPTRTFRSLLTILALRFSRWERNHPMVSSIMISVEITV